MSRATRIGSAVVALTLLGGCADQFPVKPAPPVVDTVGVLANVAEGPDRFTYTFEDGRSWSNPRSEFRIAYDMSGTRTLFLSGIDDEGRYVLLVGSQDGLPADCRFALRYGGIDWGDSIEAQGILWPKAEGFVPLLGGPSSGASYPGNAVICLDESAAVTGVHLAEPASSEPLPSARTSG